MFWGIWTKGNKPLFYWRNKYIIIKNELKKVRFFLFKSKVVNNLINIYLITFCIHNYYIDFY